MAELLNIREGEALAEALPQLVLPGPVWGPPVVVSGAALEAALASVRRLGDVRAVPYLIGLLGAADSRSRSAAAKCIQALVPRELTALVWLESRIRRPVLFAYDHWWPNDRPQLDSRLSELQARDAIREGLPLETLGALSLNANGRIREAATRSLAVFSNGEEIPFLLLRVTDWVPQVMQPARIALLERTIAENAGRFAAVLPLVERVGAMRRADHLGVVRSIHALLTETPSGLEAIGQLIAGDGDRHARRAAARLVRASKQLSPLRFRPGLTDADPIVRTLLVSALLDRGTLEELVEWVPRFLSDSSARIRSMAFTAAEAKCPGLLARHLEALLFDANFWLREFARQALGKTGGRDFRKIYREAVVSGDPKTLRAAVGGLGEVGAEEDAGVAVPHGRSEPPERGVSRCKRFTSCKERAPCKLSWSRLQGTRSVYRTLRLS